jgi:hypothetical protein
MAVDVPAVVGRIRTATGRTPKPAGPDPTADGLVEPVRGRRSWRYTAGAIAAILAGGLLAVGIYTQAQHTVTVFTTAGTIERGHTFAARDLSTLTIAPGQPVAGFTTAQAAHIVGKVATVTLPAGSMITRTAVAAALPIPSGQAVVGIAVKPSQMPATVLTVGDDVVITPIAGQAGTVVSKRAAPVDVVAVVTAAPVTDPATGLVVVDVSVASSEASDLAGRAAAGQVAVYLTSSTAGR